MKKGIKTILASIIAGVSLVFLASGLAGADHKTQNFEYLLGVDFLSGPVISKASNGDTIEIKGQGTLSIKPKSVTGGGTVVHKDPDGNVVGTGTWTAERLLTFRSWGTTEGFPENFEGGHASIMVKLVPDGSDQEFTGVLKIMCLLGKVPAWAEEGAKLWIRGAPNFREVVSGETLFIRTD